MVAACRLRRDVRRHRRGYRYADRDRSGEVGGAPAVLGSGPLRSEMFDRHTFAGLPPNPLIAGLDPRGWAHAASVSFGFPVASKRRGNYGSKHSTGSANGIFFLADTC